MTRRKCPQCGADVLVERGATVCPYCDKRFADPYAGLLDPEYGDHPVWRQDIEDSPATERDYQMACQLADVHGVKHPRRGLWKRELEDFRRAVGRRNHDALR